MRKEKMKEKLLMAKEKRLKEKEEWRIKESKCKEFSKNMQKESKKINKKKENSHEKWLEKIKDNDLIQSDDEILKRINKEREIKAEERRIRLEEKKKEREKIQRMIKKPAGDIYSNVKSKIGVLDEIAKNKNEEKKEIAKNRKRYVEIVNSNNANYMSQGSSPVYNRQKLVLNQKMPVSNLMNHMSLDVDNMDLDSICRQIIQKYDDQEPDNDLREDPNAIFKNYDNSY